MINLLPLENKIAIKKEYLRRILVVGGIFLFSIIILGNILTFSIFFLMDKQEKEYSSSLAMTNIHLSKENKDEIEAFVLDINSKTGDFLESQSKLRSMSGIIKEIISAKEGPIKIENISFSRGDGKKIKDNISVKGVGATRAGLLKFIENLERSRMFSGVQSPVANLLRERNINFSLLIELYEK